MTILNRNVRNGMLPSLALLRNSASVAVIALTVSSLSAMKAHAENECGPSSYPIVNCTANSYGNISYPAGGLVVLENSDMTVDGVITIGSMENEVETAVLNTPLYKTITGEIRVFSPKNDAGIGLYPSSNSATPGVTGILSATVEGEGNATINLLEGAWVSNPSSAVAVKALQRGTGDAIVQIEGATIDQITPGIAVNAINRGTGNSKIVMNSGTISGTADNDPKTEFTGLVAHGVSPNANAEIIFTGGTIKDTDVAMTAYVNAYPGSASIVINEDTDKADIHGQVLLTGTESYFELKAGGLSMAPGETYDAPINVEIDGNQADVKLLGGGIATYGKNGRGVVLFNQGGYETIAAVELGGTDITITGEDGVGLYMEYIADPGQPYQVDVSMSDGNILSYSNATGATAVGLNVKDQEVDASFNMSGGTIEMYSSNSDVIQATTSADGFYDFQLTAGIILAVDGTAIKILPEDDLSPNGPMKIDVTIGSDMIVSGIKGVFLNQNTDPGTITSFEVAGSATGDIIDGPGTINVVLNGGC
nr:hypothetical protein [Marinicella sp. W31]MDC2879247.1 hypothetical protein [Marinicella sp. W31]